jgi:hypothetical protein
MPVLDPEAVLLTLAYPDRTLLLSWRPDQPGVRVVLAPVGDAPDQVVQLEQTNDTDELLRRARRLVQRLPTGG